MSECRTTVKGGELTEEPEERLNLGLLCYLPARAMERRVLAAVAAAGFDDVTIAQARVFARLRPGGIRLTELAEQAQVTKQTAGFLVDQLEQAGYVQRVPDPTDRRARLVQVAERGRALLEVARVAEAEVEAEWTAHLGQRTTDQLRRALTRLRTLSDPYR